MTGARRGWWPPASGRSRALRVAGLSLLLTSATQAQPSQEQEAAAPARPQRSTSAPAPDRSVAAYSNDREARARSLFLRGDRNYAEGNYVEALISFERAYELSPRPELLFNAANALERWGCYADAAAFLQRYAVRVDAASRAVIEKRIGALARRPTTTDPNVPPCPQVTRSGARALAPPESATPPATLRSPDDVPSPPGSPPSRAAPPDQGPTARTLVGYSLLGAGAIGLGAGLLFGLSSRRDTQTVQSECLASGVCPSSASPTLDSSESSALAADVGLGVGLVALGVGAYLLLGGDSPQAPTLRAQVGTRGGSVAVMGRF